MTDIGIDGTQFLINGAPTYPGVTHDGRAIEGLLFNSRMVQALFDDDTPTTRENWRYPDTGEWDPDRNTREFCGMLPEYRRHGLLGVTVGLQGGGAIYTPDVYGAFINSAYEPDGTFKPAYFDRLETILAAADACGMIVIVNYFYVVQAQRLEDERTVARITEQVTDWLLRSGHRNIIVDIYNEVGIGKNMLECFTPDGIHRLIDIAQQTTRDGRRLPVGASTPGGKALPVGTWRELEDLHMPHGNGCRPGKLRAKLRALKASPEFQSCPKPILINEDTIYLDNLDVAVDEYASWGFYCQGYGSDYADGTNWRARGREQRFEDLSGYQTVPVNWGINTTVKKAFFSRLAKITAHSGGGTPAA